MTSELKFPVQVIAIDDNTDELNAIHTALTQSCIPCIPLHYNRGLGENVPCCDNLRILLLDINLMGGTLLKPEQFEGPLRRTLNSLGISGPYILIFWSTHADQSDPVYKLLFEDEKRSGDTPLTPPIFHKELDKTELLNEPNKDRLASELMQIIGESDIVNFLLGWEQQVSAATGQTLNFISKTCGHKHEEFQPLLKKIAEAGNDKNADRNPLSGFNRGILPLMRDFIETEQNKNSFTEITNTAFNTKQSKGGKIDKKLCNNLNCTFHFDFNSIDSNCRGVWFELNDSSCEALFGKNRKDLVNFIARKKGKRISPTDPALEKLASKLKFGLLDISAACDYGQGHDRLRPMVLTILLPQNLNPDDVKNINFLKDTMKDAVWRHEANNCELTITLDKIEYKPRVLLRFQLGLHNEHDIFKMPPLFRVREQLLNVISDTCSSHNTRPGISFFS